MRRTFRPTVKLPVHAVVFCVSVVVVLFGTIFGPVGSGFAAATKPVKNPDSLVPSPFKLELKTMTDLDRDGDTDAVMVGVNGPMPPSQEGSDRDEERVLVVARRDKDGFRRVEMGLNALICRRCGGAFFGSLPAEISVDANRSGFETFQEAGSREMTRWTHRYRLENGRVRLIGLDRSLTDRNTAGVVVESTNYLTGTKIVTVEGELENPPKAGTTKGKPRTIFLNAVKVE